MGQLTCPVCASPIPASASVCPTCGAPLNQGTGGTLTASPEALISGTHLNNGSFSVGRMLGRGGFGITYLGADLRLRRPVAIKEFFPSGSGRNGTRVLPPAGLTRDEFEQARQKFLQEARTLARFRHPSIVNVYEVFEENDTAYMVMEYLQGENLLERMERQGKPLEEPFILEVTGPIAEALDEVHAAGILHRDIKPENIMLVENGRVLRPVLIDFGAAREFASGMANRHSIVLTPGYAPLEQYGEQARRGPFTDVYALAATLYHVATGQQPPAATERALGVVLQAPRKLNPALGVTFDSADMHGMEMKVDERPQSASQFYAELSGGRPVLHPTPVPVPVPRLDPVPPSPQMPAPAPPPPSPALPSTGKHMDRVRQIAREIGTMGPVQTDRFLCPICRHADMQDSARTIAGTTCPVCHSAVLRERFSTNDLLLCPSCSRGELQAVSSPLRPDALTRCPACRIGSLVTYLNSQKILPDLWARCDTCRANFDYHAQGDRLTLKELPSGTGYLAADMIGKTGTRLEWAALAGQGSDAYGCPVCAAEFQPCGDDKLEWVAGGMKGDVPAEQRGRCRSRLDWAKMAHHVPTDQGSVECPSCRAQFDEPEAATLTLLSAPQDPYGTVAAHRGRTYSAAKWRALATGRSAAAEYGLICSFCTAELQAQGGGKHRYSLVSYNPTVDPYGVGHRYLNHQLSLGDWRRVAAGGVPAADDQRLREEARGEFWKALLAGEVSTSVAEDTFPESKKPGEKIILTLTAAQFRSRFGFLSQRDVGQIWLTTRRLLYRGDRDSVSILLRDVYAADVLQPGPGGLPIIEIQTQNKGEIFRFSMAPGATEYTVDGLALELQWDEESFIELFESLRGP